MLLRKRWKLLVYSLLPPFIGFVLIYAWLGTTWRTLLFEPFATAARNQEIGFSFGIANIHAIAHLLLIHVSPVPSWAASIPYLLPIALTCLMASFFAMNDPDADGRILLAVLLSGGLACFPHLTYDFTALIFALAIGLKSAPCRMRSAVIVLVGYFWYLQKIPSFAGSQWKLYLILSNFILLMVLIAATYRLRSKVTWGSRWQL